MIKYRIKGYCSENFETFFLKLKEYERFEILIKVFKCIIKNYIYISRTFIFAKIKVILLIKINLSNILKETKMNKTVNRLVYGLNF